MLNDVMSKSYRRRARPGKGKGGFYGLDLDKKLIRFQAVSIRDTASSDLLRFVDMYLGFAADLAKCGKKDSARNWARFFRNSRVLDVLEKAGHGVAHLRRTLGELEAGCYPTDQMPIESDLQAIKGLLERILARVEAPAQQLEFSNLLANERGLPVGQPNQRNEN